MASAKRKESAILPKNRDERSTKRRRLDTSDKKKRQPFSEGNAKTGAVIAASSKLPAISPFANEQPAFPRGGAEILTPLEKKQIRAQAERDVLIEQKRKKNKEFLDSDGDDEPSSNSHDESSNEISAKIRKPKVKKSSKRAKVEKTQVDLAPRIEGLNYKRISSGSLILGQIAKVNLKDLAVSLPNNLTGYVPLTAVSTQLTERLESTLSKGVEDGLDDESSDGESDPFNLSDYVHPGQWVRVAVTSTGEDTAHAAEKAKKRIELSLEPRLTNQGLGWKDLAVDCTLQASVNSVEDHGVIVDLGLSDGKIQGFIPSRELPHGLKISHVKPGMIFLCLVTGLGGGDRIVRLSAKVEDAGKDKARHALGTAPSVNSFLPGTAVEILLSDVTKTGLAGKVMGLLDVTSDIVQSGARSTSSSLQETYKPGKKIFGRLVYTFPLSDSKKLGFSVLNHVIRCSNFSADQNTAAKNDLHVSSLVEKAKIVRVDPGLGVYLKLGPDSEGFAHMSRLSDSKIDTLSADDGPFKVGSNHRARVLDYNAVDNLFILSLQETVIQQPFLRVEDVVVGDVVKGKVEKLLSDESGLKGLILQLSEGVTGFVPRIHLSDAQLQHPEKKFREGISVSARVLSTDVMKRQVRLTLKKSLVNSDLTPWTSFSQISDGASSLGTLVKVLTNGAVVQFYGPVRGFLPVAEMSEAYIKDATQHFRVGQVLHVNCLHVDVELAKLTVSCRDPSVSGAASHQALQDLPPGAIVQGTVFEKSEDDLLLRLADSNTIARLELDHISDGSLRKRQSALSKTRVGQQLSGLLVLEVQVKRRLVRLCNRASLLTAAKDGSLLRGFPEVREGKKVTGFISNITSDGVFVSFLGGLAGLLAKSQIPTELLQVAEFGFARLQTISTTIRSIDYKVSPPRFWLTMKAESADSPAANGTSEQTKVLVDAIDGRTTLLDELNVGAVTKARIASVKETQINVELAKNVLGRVDVSEIFDEWEDIKDRKKPLRAFSPNQVLAVRVLGAHDARNHRFLPISHRAGKTPVFELSAKPSYVKRENPEVLTLDKVHVGSSWLAFVNNIAEDCLWVNISPNVRGRIRAIDVSDDLSLVANLDQNFPIGSALKVQVISVDVDKNHLDLTAKASGSSNQLSFKELSKGMILPGRITKTSERQVLVQLSDTIVGAVNLIDLSDDYAKADPTGHRKNVIVRVCVVDVDVPNKKLLLSLRPSKVLSSSLPVEDKEITSVQQLHVNDVVRGFICNVADQGLFVTLGHGVTAFVRISNLSDSYLKEWKDAFQRDQLVRGKIISVDAETSHIQMSLKESVLKSDYVAPTTFSDLRVEQIVTGKVAKVEDFGVFIVIDHSANVRGLCHRSEIAEQRVEDARKLFNEGDAVKAKVLKLEPETRRISFGLKASYFNHDTGEEDVDSVEGEDALAGGVKLTNGAEGEGENSHESDEADTADDLSEDDENVFGIEPSSDIDPPLPDNDEDMDTARSTKPSPLSGLQVGGFDWHGLSRAPASNHHSTPSSDTEQAPSKPKKKRKAAIQLDLTGDLDKHGPQSPDDFERLLLSSPDSSLLWLQYMAFHLSLGEIDTARTLAQRGLKTISPLGGGGGSGSGSETEKLNLWIALLNLENAYGDDESIEATFRSACEVNDPQEIHERLASIYIQSLKHDKADALFQGLVKRFGAGDAKIWVNYATFLFERVGEPERGRVLLGRALQALPRAVHVDVTARFAGLEFRTRAGVAERGRTILEGLLDAFPRRVDLWNVWLDLEIRGERGEGGEGEGEEKRVREEEKKVRVRRLFERILEEGGGSGSGSGGTGRRIKNKQAKFFFKRWLEFEEGIAKGGDQRAVEAVKKRAVQWVREKKAEEP